MRWTLLLLVCVATRADNSLPGTIPDGKACLSSSACMSGVCEGQGCGDIQPGRCVPARRICPRNRVPFCGCDNATFYSSSACPGRRYRRTGECPS